MVRGQSESIESFFGNGRAVAFASAPAGTVHFVEWTMPTPVTLGGFNLYAYADRLETFDHFRLQVKLGDNSYQTVYDEDVTVPHASSLAVSSAVPTITARQFRAEFTQYGGGIAIGGAAPSNWFPVRTLTAECFSGAPSRALLDLHHIGRREQALDEQVVLEVGCIGIVGTAAR
jgi:hypothetical protein